MRPIIFIFIFIFVLFSLCYGNDKYMKLEECRFEELKGTDNGYPFDLLDLEESRDFEIYKFDDKKKNYIFPLDGIVRRQELKFMSALEKDIGSNMYENIQDVGCAVSVKKINLHKHGFVTISQIQSKDICYMERELVKEYQFFENKSCIDQKKYECGKITEKICNSCSQCMERLIFSTSCQPPEKPFLTCWNCSDVCLKMLSQCNINSFASSSDLCFNVSNFKSQFQSSPCPEKFLKKVWFFKYCVVEDCYDWNDDEEDIISWKTIGHVDKDKLISIWNFFTSY